MGQVFSGGSHRPVTADDLQMSLEARQSLSDKPVPLLQHRDNRNEYLFLALFDGSGQDLNQPKLGPPTNVGELARQLEKLENDPGNRIAGHYSKGIGTQDNAIGRSVDGALALSWADGIEKTYRQFAQQSARWLRENPDAQISLAGAGYSRGAVQLAGLTRLVNQYGVADPEDLSFGRDAHGNITIISARPPLVAPGEVAQAVGLFDPVATNMPRNYDARLGASVISSVSLLAAHERRELFPHLTVDAPGMTADGRGMNVPVPGGHSNVGGGNRSPGLEILAGNMMIDYLNQLRDVPMFDKRPLPDDLAAYAAYQARGVTAVFGARLDRDGQRDLREELANCKIVDPCRDAEPVNRGLADRFDYRNVPSDAVEEAQLRALMARAPGHSQQQAYRPDDLPSLPRETIAPSGDPHVDRYIGALLAGDADAARAASRAFSESTEGQRMLADGQAQARAERERLPGRDSPLFAQALQHVERLGPQAGGYRDQEQLERVAGALAVRAREAGMPGIGAVLVSQDGNRLFAVGHSPSNPAAPHAQVDKFLAANQPLERSLSQLAAETQRQDADAQRATEQREREAQASPAMSR